MRRIWQQRLVGWTGYVAGVSLVTLCAWGVTQTPVQAAECSPLDVPMTCAPSQAICRAALVFDRSGSVGQSNVDTLRAQVSRLFQPGSPLYDAKVNLAFWSFSHNHDGRSFNLLQRPNFMAPFHDFVTTHGQSSTFRDSLAQLVSNGGTNYEQGLGFNNGERITTDGVDKVVNRSDIIVFMTDGQPNEPRGVGNARKVALTAADALKAQRPGRVIIGGMIGDTSTADLSYVINGGNSKDKTNIFYINDDYSNLARQIQTQVQQKCLDILPKCEWDSTLLPDDPRCKPPVAPAYALTPSVTGGEQGTVISGTDGAAFQYHVDNNGAPSEPTKWSVKRVIVDRGQAVDPLYFNNPPYRDDNNYANVCDTLIAYVNGKARCDEVSSGQLKFSNGHKTLSALDGLSPAAMNISVDDAWQVGTKVCYVLAVSRPTQNATPDNRYSRAACAIVGKHPTVQVRGGDVSVGRYFKTTDITPTPPGVHGLATVKGGAINRTFGSWAEYAVVAPGVVSGFASASGLAGGRLGAVASFQDQWSDLTFANQGGYGQFTSQQSMGPVTNVAAYLLHGRPVAGDLASASNVVLDDPSAAGLYQKPNGDLLISQKPGTFIAPGKTIIVYVPNGTATIGSDLLYKPGPYQSIGQLPQLIIIAKNIVIGAGVKQVDAWLIAQDGDGNGGIITTCDTSGTLTSEICNQTLTINGPIIAKDIRLKRTGGAGVGGASADPAEILNLRADAFLWAYAEGRSDIRAETTHTIELPPQF